MGNSRRHYAALLPRGMGIDAIGVFEEEYSLIPVVEEEVEAPVAEVEEAATLIPALNARNAAYYGTQAALGWAVGGPVGALLLAGWGWLGQQEPGVVQQTTDLLTWPGRFVADLLE